MSNPFSYEDKRVVVTGAATGVGAGLLEVLAEQGAAHVTVVDVKAPSGPHQTYLQTDLADPKAVDAVFTMAPPSGMRSRSPSESFRSAR